MAEPIKINTGDYAKEGKVEVDGMVWSVTLSGAGTELRFSQASRACKLWSARITSLEKKIEGGNPSDSDLDAYEEAINKFEKNEAIVFDTFKGMLNDGTDDNSQVEKWLRDTPSFVMWQVFEDIKAQGSENLSKQENKDEPTEPTGSTG